MGWDQFCIFCPMPLALYNCKPGDIEKEIYFDIRFIANNGSCDFSTSLLYIYMRTIIHGPHILCSRHMEHAVTGPRVILHQGKQFLGAIFDMNSLCGEPCCSQPNAVDSDGVLGHLGTGNLAASFSTEPLCPHLQIHL